MNVLKTLLLHIPRDYFFFKEVQELFPNKTPGACYSFLHRLTQAGTLQILRKGLYLFNPPYRRYALNMFEMAALLPENISYISLESALSYHGFIPERIATTTSVICGQPLEFHNHIGLFTYARPTVNISLQGVQQEKSFWGGSYLMATPEKAFLDFIAHHKLRWQNKDVLTVGYRMDEDILESLSFEKLRQLNGLYSKKYMTQFIHALEKAL